MNGKRASKLAWLLLSATFAFGSWVWLGLHNVSIPGALASALVMAAGILLAAGYAVLQVLRGRW